MKLTSLQQAQQFFNEATACGFDVVVVNPSVVRIVKHFTPGDKDAYTYCDMFAGSILSLAPLKGGSVWGTDGASVGGWSGLQNGKFELAKSGEGKRFTAALVKVINKVVGR